MLILLLYSGYFLHPGYHQASLYLFYFYYFGFQASEFFDSSQRSAAAQQREMEANQSGETSLESPLLEQVKILFQETASPSPLFSFLVSLSDRMLVVFIGYVNRCIQTSEAWLIEWSCAKGKVNGFWTYLIPCHKGQHFPQTRVCWWTCHRSTLWRKGFCYFFNSNYSLFVPCKVTMQTLSNFATWYCDNVSPYICVLVKKICSLNDQNIHIHSSLQNGKINISSYAGQFWLW